jgi:amino acid transporter
MVLWKRKPANAPPVEADEALSKDQSHEPKTSIGNGGDSFHADPAKELHRGLKTRHITMIAIGGAIGTGLIIGTGKALATAG